MVFEMLGQAENAYDMSNESGGVMGTSKQRPQMVVSESEAMRLLESNEWVTDLKVQELINERTS